MRISHLRDRSIVFESGWNELRVKWIAAELKDKLVLEDGRPAVRLYVDESGRHSYQSLYPAIWAMVKEQQRHRIQAPGQPVRHPKRARLCQQCGAEMELTKEYGSTWSFACKQCKSSEVHGKHLVGGTEGAGDVETR